MADSGVTRAGGGHDVLRGNGCDSESLSCSHQSHQQSAAWLSLKTLENAQRNGPPESLEGMPKSENGRHIQGHQEGFKDELNLLQPHGRQG